MIQQQFSTNIEDWAICDDNVYIDISDFVSIKTDKKGRLLEAITTDGKKIVYGDFEVRGSIINNSLEQINNSLDHVSNIINDSNSENPHGYLDEIQNFEWLNLIIDSENKILEGTKVGTGEKYIGGDTKIGGNVTIRGNVFANGYESITACYYFKYLIGNTICIGDSTTYGFNNVATENGHIDSSQQLFGTYPKYFSKIADCDVVNAGAPAQGAKSWYNNCANTYDYSQFDFVIINLGTNYGLTDTLIEDTQGETYEDYANTNTGCYCKLIEKILETNPNIKIALSYPQTRTGLVEPGETAAETSMQVCVKVIDEIAEKYNLPVLDDRNHYNVNPYQSSDGSHLTRVGNLLRAITFYTQIISYIQSHMDLWKFEAFNR